jgi:hypothetical protein
MMPAVRELDGWTKQEMLQMAAKLKAVVQSCSHHQQQVNLQVSNSGAAHTQLQGSCRRAMCLHQPLCTLEGRMWHQPPSS